MWPYLVGSCAILGWIAFIVSFVYDRSRYRNCALLFLATGFTIPALCGLAGEHSGRLLYLCLIVITAVILVVPFSLIINGIHMIKREGHSLSNLLSLFLGIAVGIGEIATVIALFGPLMAGRVRAVEMMLSRLSAASALISITILYGSLAFLMFLMYTLFLQLVPHKRDFDYVIIHGAGLLEGNKISRLLADRLDKAIAVYQKDPTPPILIPSGGKGGDEKVSEAEAMAGYLREHGIPDDKILLEDQSENTYENLWNSKVLIDIREGRKYTALVTSNYHVYRALRYCRKIGIQCTGIGAHVAHYYLPSALIREFVAIHREKKHAALFLGGWILCIALYLLWR